MKLRLASAWRSVALTLAALLPLMPGPAMAAEAKAAAAQQADPRLARVLARLQAGQSIKVGAIGGSITTGYASPQPEQQGWAARVVAWLAQQSAATGAKVEFVNLGVSGTDSAVAAQRVRAQAIDTQLDLVFVEFGVNDLGLDARVRTHSYEGLLRQLLKSPKRPAVVALMLTLQDNQNRDAVEVQLPLAAHYGLVAVDFGSWVDARVARRELRWEDLYDEPVHPNQRGHDVIAAAVIEALSTHWRAKPANAAPAAAADVPVPAPLHSNEHEFVSEFGSREITPYRSTGFAQGSDVHPEWARRPGGAKEGWVSRKDGATMSFLVYGRQIGIFHSESDGYRNLEAWVDEQPPVPVMTHNPTRSGFLGWAYTPVGHNLADGAHLLHVRMRKDEFQGSGRQAGISSIMTAGLSKSGLVDARADFVVGDEATERLQLIKPDHPAIAYVGRFDNELRNAPLMAWSGSELRVRFTGRRLALRLGAVNGPNYFNATVDGKPYRLQMAREGSNDYLLNATLSPGEHELSLVKRTEGYMSQARFLGLLIERDAKLGPKPTARPLRLEFYGDSITAGACNGDAGDDQYEDQSTHDGTSAYGAVAARRLGADYVGIAVSGTGITQSWNEVLMPAVFDRVVPGANAARADFSGRAPDVVLVNLGQNDFGFPQSRGEPFPADFTERYVAFIQRLRALYPRARIVALMGGMSGWRNSPELLGGFKKAVAQLQRSDSRLWSYTFQAYTDNHPRIDTHELLATELVAFLRSEVLK